jgi:hypothetical protein
MSYKRGWGAVWSSAAAHMHVPESVRPGETAWCVMCCAVCRVVWQSTGATPLFVTSQTGHVECVLALLRGGAAINQATVGCAKSMTWPCGGCVRVALLQLLYLNGL